MYAVWPFKMNELIPNSHSKCFAICPNIILFAKTTTNSGFVNCLKNVVNCFIHTFKKSHC